MSTFSKIDPDLKFIKEIKAAGGETLKNCYQCATCSVVCKLSPAQSAFPRKEMLWAEWGLKDRLLSDPDVWLCHQCNDCSTHCPRGAKPGDVLAAVREYAFKQFAFPGFMGKALASKGALLPLLLVPALILFALLMLIHGGSFNFLNHPVDFAEFFPHIYLEIFFIGGNILIFAFAAIGLYRFWRGLTHSSARHEGHGFIPSAIAALVELLFHRKFYDCEANKPRALAHILVFGGFIGAMITAGLAVGLTAIIPLIESPIDLPNPVKILGVLSGAAMIIGGSMMIIRRLNDTENTEKNGYADWLFLNMLFLTGLTGLLTYVSRLIGIPAAAYIVYFIHLVIVFFLLWYAPYSKFAHMFYRTLAITWAKSKGRGEARGKN